MLTLFITSHSPTLYTQDILCSALSIELKLNKNFKNWLEWTTRHLQVIITLSDVEKKMCLGHSENKSPHEHAGGRVQVNARG